MGLFNKIATSGSGVVLAREYQEYKYMKQQSRRSSAQSQTSQQSQSLPGLSDGIRLAHGGLSSLDSSPNRRSYDHGDLQTLPLQLNFVAPSKDYSYVKEQWVASR